LQIHRTNVMRKMAADSLADLVRMAGSLDIPVAFNRRM
jgi:FixJ family two-component response regulator